MCSDPDRDWYPSRRVCYASMAEASANRRYDALHENRPYHNGTFGEWRERPDTDHLFSARDGVTITVAEYDPTPGEDFLNPAPPVTAEEVDDGSTS